MKIYQVKETEGKDKLVFWTFFPENGEVIKTKDLSKARFGYKKGEIYPEEAVNLLDEVMTAYDCGRLDEIFQV